jgi:hypothetical protein
MAATLIGLSGTIVSHAQTEEEVSALVAEALLLPDWDHAITVTGGAGYKDNVFLSHDDPQSSPFALLSAELLILRLAPEGPRLTFFANGEARFYSEKVSNQEYVAFSQVSLEQDFSDVLTGAISAQYFYQDQVLDVSISETNRQAVTVVGHTLALEPRLRAQLPSHNWIEASAPLSRELYDAPLDDYWVLGAKFSAGHDYGRDSQVSVSYSPLWQPYDTDPARTASGTAITNSHRFAFQQDTRLTWRHYWDPQKRWRTTATIGARWNDENGGGFSDYTRLLASGRVRYRVSDWEITAEGRVAHYDYWHQTVSATDPAKRRRTEWSTGLNIERQWLHGLTFLVRYEYETIWSNDPLETYSVNTVTASLGWEF